MFRIVAFVENKHVGDVLQAMIGKVIGQPQCQPVANAKLDKGKVKAVSDGSSVGKFAAYLNEVKPDRLIAKDVRAILPKLGMSENSYSYLLKQAIEAGLLRKKGIGAGMYYVPHLSTVESHLSHMNGS